MIPADDVFNNLLWEPADAQTIAEAIEGGTITGAEPIDYPLTDGLIIYLTGRSGRQLALEIGADPDADPTEGNPFYINLYQSCGNPADTGGAAAMITYQTERTLAEISSTGSSAKRLTVTSWNGNPAKLDLRIWRTDEAEPKPGKGITLTDAEAQTLLDALQGYVRGAEGADMA